MNQEQYTVDEEKLFRNKISFLSFICCFCVFFIHSNNVKNYSDSSGLWYTIITLAERVIVSDIARVAVPMFFAISGFLFFRNYDYSKIITKYRSRFRSIFVPYVVWNVIYMVAFYIMDRLHITSAGGGLDLLSAFKGIFLYEYHASYWFMFQLIIYIVITPVLFALMKSRIASLLLIASLFILRAYPPTFLISDFIRPDGLLFFYMGGYAAFRYEKYVIHKASKKARWIGAFILVLSQAIWFVQTAAFQDNLLLQTLRNLMMVVGLYILVDCFKLPKVSGFFTTTFFIYSIHEIILEIVQHTINILLPYSCFRMSFDFFASPIIAMMIILITEVIMQRWTPRLYVLLSGDRKQ